MNWDAVGAVAELAGATGVVITLAYLAVQMRQNSKLVVTSIANSDRDATNDLARILGSNGEVARIYRIGIEDRASLTPDEIIQFDSLCFLAFNSLHLRYKQNDAVDMNGGIFTQFGNRQYWEVYSGAFPEDFRIKVTRAFEQFDEAAAQQRATTDSA